MPADKLVKASLQQLLSYLQVALCYTQFNSNTSSEKSFYWLVGVSAIAEVSEQEELMVTPDPWVFQLLYNDAYFCLLVKLLRWFRYTLILIWMSCKTDVWLCNVGQMDLWKWKMLNKDRHRWDMVVTVLWVDRVLCWCSVEGETENKCSVFRTGAKSGCLILNWKTHHHSFTVVVVGTGFHHVKNALN